MNAAVSPRRRRAASLTLLTAALLFPLAGGAHPAAAEERIPLKAAMILEETAAGADPAPLVDEQDAIGDPAAKTGTQPKSKYFPGWGDGRYPMQFLIDLGAPTAVTRLFIYNNTGSAPLAIATGKPFAWNTQDVEIKGYLTWNEFPLNTTTRFLRLTVKRPTDLYEIALYGTRPTAQAAKPPKKAAVAAPLQPTMDQMIGTNAFIDDPIEKLTPAVGFIREYHDWHWDTEAPDHQVRFQPSGAAGGNAWFFDDFYRKLKAGGVTVCPAIQQTNPSLFPGADLDAKPVEPGKDTEAAASYALHAAHMYQYAARYGAAKVPDAQLKLAAGQPRVSGLGTLRYIEDWNEPDKTWKGREGRFSPYDLAAMCSADRDGDQGRMGKNVGMRNADPNMKLVLGGLAGIQLRYLDAMKLWSDYHRNGDFPVDVINVHHYCSDGDDMQGFKSVGVSPEAGRLREKMAAVVKWRDANAPGREVWLTEFGYDTNGGSPIHSPAIGSYSAEEVQAIWLVRSYLELAAAGVDRAAMFMFRDVDPKSGGVFATCGMVTEKGAWTPKPSYFYIATLKHRLAGMRFAGEVESGQNDVKVYRFAGPQGATAYAVWCTTSNDAKVPGVKVKVTGKTVTRIDFANGKLDGEATPLPSAGGTITLEAREKPVLLVVR